MRLRQITTVKTYGCKGIAAPIWRLSILFSIIGFILYVVGFSSSHWYDLHLEAANTEAKVMASSHSGLWRTCSHVTLPSGALKATCRNTSNDEVWQCASKAMCTAGLALLALGLASGVLAGCYSNKSYNSSSSSSSSSILKGASGLMLVVGSVISALGATLYICKSRSEYSLISIQYPFVLVIVGTMFLIVAGGLQLLSIESDNLSIA